MVVPKVSYYEVQVVFWWWIIPVLCWKAQKSEVRVGIFRHVSALRGRQGCSKSAVTPLRVTQSSCRYVHRVPRASTLKLYRWFSSALPVVVCRSFESGAKIGGFDMRQPSEVVFSQNIDDL